ncbi:hypothetical protein [uncultured Desulfovibrio sp.]|uniref:hypothetical protein n=1 Tax=uncultured Desulfovibrio sp. TaxID=167968 RepID=UPI0003A27057|nr:hypothetical protein [uncultured Desulfovibrio sp.]
MKRSREILTGPLCIALLAAAFCIWSAFGNGVNFCVTAGCSLYQDFTVGGISLWWLGTGTFAVLALLALLGAAAPGRLLAGLALLGDICLLLLMALTAPCVSCLVVAVFFVLTYLGFRHAEQGQARGRGIQPRRSPLLLLWILLFTVNVGTVTRSQTAIWPIAEGDEATVRMFFSPSCPSCREGIDILSGHVDVAFYPLAENDSDVYRVAQMRRLLDTGMNLAEALGQSQNVPPARGFAALSPDLLWLRFRMLRNKAHVFSAGAQTVPFFEYHGLPSILIKQQARQNRQLAGSASNRTDMLAPPSPSQSRDTPSSARDGQTGSQPEVQNGQDAALPLTPQVAGQCRGTTPCP